MNISVNGNCFTVMTADLVCLFSACLPVKCEFSLISFTLKKNTGKLPDSVHCDFHADDNNYNEYRIKCEKISQREETKDCSNFEPLLRNSLSTGCISMVNTDSRSSSQYICISVQVFNA